MWQVWLGVLGLVLGVAVYLLLNHLLPLLLQLPLLLVGPVENVQSSSKQLALHCLSVQECDITMH